MKKQRKSTLKRAKTEGSRGRTQRLEVIRPQAAGIDIGAREHYVAVEGTVRTFGCLTPDLYEMAKWLKREGIETVAMESTGVYWIPVVNVLEEAGFEVLLVDARQVKAVPGRKSDVQDCEWLRQLHRYGLLAGAFRPEQEIQPLRGYWRHRQGLVQACSQQIHLMQKALEQMNLQLHKVLSDITGVTGMAILRAIVAGQRDAVALAKLKHPLVKSSEDDIVKALTGTYREDQVFVLEQALALYDVLHKQLQQCDKATEQYMERLEKKTEVAPSGVVSPKKVRKNQPHFDLHRCLEELTGVDLTQIDGIDVLTAQTVITEAGTDMSRFPTEKHFASWLGLCPNHQITGGKIKKNRTRKVQNRAAKALRLAAQSLHHSKSALGGFFRRMKAHHGPAKAITATARKLAILIYRMLRNGMDYVDQGCKQYEKQMAQQQLNNLRKRAISMGYHLVSIASGEIVS